MLKKQFDLPAIFVNSGDGTDTERERLRSLKSWMIDQAINQDITIRENMPLFWYHFIPVDCDFIRASSNEYISGNTSRV